MGLSRRDRKRWRSYIEEASSLAERKARELEYQEAVLVANGVVPSAQMSVQSSLSHGKDEIRRQIAETIDQT